MQIASESTKTAVNKNSKYNTAIKRKHRYRHRSGEVFAQDLTDENGGGGILEARPAFGVSNPLVQMLRICGGSNPLFREANPMEAGGFEPPSRYALRRASTYLVV